ncbi:MAG: hypothetical protein AABY07_01715 [Nanoarchaeota archaeon]
MVFDEATKQRIRSQDHPSISLRYLFSTIKQGGKMRIPFDYGGLEADLSVEGDKTVNILVHSRDRQLQLCGEMDGEIYNLQRGTEVNEFRWTLPYLPGDKVEAGKPSYCHILAL